MKIPVQNNNEPVTLVLLYSVSSKLRCFQCGHGGSKSDPLSCFGFNATTKFIVECSPDEHACLKGWVSDDQVRKIKLCLFLATL